MASRKEDEKNERTIRNLLKLPDNRRCINCNSLGPQYVCTNFWTFVCTNCSGIHREFTHRVKSISMAKFTSQEVSALQGGGNASAKEIYLKEWDPQRQSLPDGSNVERLRDFIKHVYVERRYSGERSSEKPPRGKMGGTEDSYENRRNDSFQSGSRSPPYDDANERRLSDRLSSGGRSPAYEQDNRQYDKRSPARTEVVNDWRREDRFGNGRRLEDRVSDGGSKFDSRSPDRQRDADASSPPVVRPVRDILGDNVSPLRVLEPPKGNGLRTQRTASSSSLASSNGNATETKFETSLIDFDAAPEPPAPPAAQPPQAATSVPVAQTAMPSNDNWANFDSVAEVKVSQPPVNTNPLESMLSQLSVPSSIPGDLTGTPGSGTGLPTSSAATVAAFPDSQQVASFGLPFGNVAPPASVANKSAAFLSGPPSANTGPGVLPQLGGNAFGNPVTGGHWSQPQTQSLFPAMAGQLPARPSISPAIQPASNEPWNPLSAPNLQGIPGVATVQAPQTVVNPTLETSSGLNTQKSLEVKSSGRSALPEDLFSMNFAQIPVQAPGWNTGPPFGMGFNMQYNVPMPVAPIPQATKSTNPFDVNNDPPAQAFPSMAPLQSALPNMPAPTNLLRTSSLGTPGAHPSTMHPSSASYASVMPSNANMMPQLPSNMPARPLGPMNFGMDAGVFGHLSSNQPMGGLQSLPAAPNNFSSVGGNPFG
ncbi:OLC1v1037258C1 [Oldenlandia corymbosa var. corymbosa]|uniref:OLC1v1037258C1 n=1 Tax=Oldenlandia corymbosa var. corymbosa TaxID=529605 RepID=A0AAV1CYN2_OLDCO|nr:OLC1v1037258C1 [Oldenlandia corymbosa var. corymbosa]